MAESISGRIQPQRACNRPNVSFDHAAALQQSTPSKTTQRQRKKSRQPSRSKLITKRHDVGHEADPNVWKNLGDDMIDHILSFLPVYKLHETVMALGATRWALVQTILAPPEIRDSAIGFIRAYFNVPARPGGLNRIARKCLQSQAALVRPRVLEYDTNTWHAMPRWPAYLNVEDHLRLKILYVCDGLLCLGKVGRCRMTVPVGLRLGPRHAGPVLMLNEVILIDYKVDEIGVWNPVTNTHRWICRSPFHTCNPEKPVMWWAIHMAVDRDRKGYKVVALMSTVVAIQAHAHTFFFHRHVSSYAVYDSGSASWSAVRPAPRRNSQLTLSRVSVSCEGRFVFVLGKYEARSYEWEWPVGLVCYTPCTDSWVEVMFCPEFLHDLVLSPTDHPATFWCCAHSLLYSAGKLYLIFRSCMLRGRPPLVRTTVPAAEQTPRGHAIHVVSIDLVNVLSGIASFELVTRVRSTEEDCSNGHPRPWPARVDEERRSELTVARECAVAGACLKSWYICKIGGRRYLCALVCGKWLEMFDLVAQKWDARRAMQVAADSIDPETRHFTPEDWAYTPSGISP